MGSASKPRLLERRTAQLGVALVAAAAFLLVVVLFFGLRRERLPGQVSAAVEGESGTLPHKQVRTGKPDRQLWKPADPDRGEEGRYDDHPAIRHYKSLTRYPPSTRRLTANSSDLLNPNARSERRRPVPDREQNRDRSWEVLFTADRYFVRGSESTLVSLALWHGDEPVMPENVRLIAEPDAGRGNAPPITIPVKRAGSAVTAAFLPNEHWPDLVGPFRVTGTFSAKGLREQTGFLSFYFTAEDRIPARFTGTFQDRLSQGDLVVDAGIDVNVGGPYRIEGNLFDESGRPIAWASFGGELAPGVQTVPLSFYGLVFHDAEASPPFVLRDLRGYRQRRGDSPHREDIPTFAGEYRTGDQYTLENFRKEVHDSPRKRQMLKLYQDALDRGVHLTEPQYTGTEQ